MSAPLEPGRLVVEALRLDRWSRPEVETRAARALELGVAGFVLFGGEADEVARLTARLAREAGRPLWFAADLERGAGQQFRGLSELPPPAALGALDAPDGAVAEAGRRTGLEAASVGINWVLAPVLDLDAERRNPIVATRSFGSDPALVARLGKGWIDACQEAGVIACAKHFPGHGRTIADSHITLPVVEAGAEALEADLAPFAQTADRVGSMMVAHVAYPGWGSERPATLARPIVTGLLRDRLGFRGPIATDAMIMGAIDGDAAVAVQALEAGCDLVLYPHDAKATVAALDRALRTERFARRAREAAATAGRALDRVTAHRAAPAAGPPFDALSFAAGTVVDRSGGLQGWRRDARTRAVGLSDDPDVGPPAGRAGPLGALLAAELADRGWTMTGPDQPAEQAIIVLAATPRAWKGRGDPSADAVESARREATRAARALVVLLGHPRWLDSLGLPGICAWSTEDVMERAAARWLAEAVGR